MNTPVRPVAANAKETLKNVMAWLRGQSVIKRDIDITKRVKISKARLSELMSENKKTLPSPALIKAIENAYLVEHKLRFEDFEQGPPMQYDSQEDARFIMLNTKISHIDEQNNLILEQQQQIMALLTQVTTLMAQAVKK